MSESAGPGDEVRPPDVSGAQIRVVFSGLLLVLLLAALDSTIVATALPTIVGELGGLAHLSWVVTAYLLAETIVTPLYGKLGDLYGRKIVLQTGIVVFLAGSALCGLSTSMFELILFRAIQGLGGGGLVVTTQAVIGDIVPPREQGRYQGIFGGVFGLASIIGPLLGGYFTTRLTWRWIFYVNVPLGIIALVVLAATLPRRPERVKHRIDWAGAAALALALSAITLLSDLGGGARAWSSPLMLALVAAAALGVGGFMLAESRAAEPVLPLRLFADPTFGLTSAIGLIVGFALFGSVTYLPLFLQVVKGVSPTASGLEMLPMMGGMLVTSVLSGQLISSTGHYKIYPVGGTGLMALGLWLLSRMSAHTSTGTALLLMLILGLGLGMVMQVLVVAVQNAVDYRDLGVATSGATLFRLIGGSVGTAVLGAIFAARLDANLARLLPAGTTAAAGGAAGMSPGALKALPPALRAAYAAAFTASLGMVFLVAAAVGAFGFLLTWLVPERPLRETIAAGAAGPGVEIQETFPMPTGDATVPQLLRGLSALADRDVRRRQIEALVREAGAPLSAAAAWLLVRLERDPALDPGMLGLVHRVPPERMAEAVAELRDAGLIQEAVVAGRPRRPLTRAGCDVLDGIARVRRQRIAALREEWPAEQREEIAAVLRRLAQDLVPEAEPGEGGRAA